MWSGEAIAPRAPAVRGSSRSFDRGAGGRRTMQAREVTFEAPGRKPVVGRRVSFGPPARVCSRGSVTLRPERPGIGIDLRSRMAMFHRPESRPKTVARTF